MLVRVKDRPEGMIFTFKKYMTIREINSLYIKLESMENDTVVLGLSGGSESLVIADSDEKFISVGKMIDKLTVRLAMFEGLEIEHSMGGEFKMSEFIQFHIIGDSLKVDITEITEHTNRF